MNFPLLDVECKLKVKENQIGVRDENYYYFNYGNVYFKQCCQ